MYIRESYLKQIRKFYEVEEIKVLMGIRRSGKSSLLKQIKSELLEKYNEEQIIFINLEIYKYYKYKDKDVLYNYIIERSIINKKLFILIDEIQLVREFEIIINSLKVEIDCSIFITGSNSTLLSSEIGTLLSGRYVKFDIYPFSFREYLDFKNNMKEKEVFEKYIRYGSLPQTCIHDDEDMIQVLLSDIKDSIVEKDIKSRYDIKNATLFSNLLEYILNQTANDFSIKNIENYILSNLSNTIKRNTIYDYIKYIEEANIIKSCYKYDLKGKRILDRVAKYYLTDIGFKNCYYTLDEISKGQSFENIVFNKLIQSGYKVYTGKTSTYEIDFVAKFKNEILYIQVSYNVSDDITLKRELKPFYNVKDNHKKILITSHNDIHLENGIIHLNIIDFLNEY